MNESNEKTVSSYTKIFQEKLKKEEELKNKLNNSSNIKDEQKEIQENKNIELNNNNNEEKIQKGINFDNLADWEMVI